MKQGIYIMALRSILFNFSLLIILFSQSVWATFDAPSYNEYYLGLSLQRDQNTSTSTLTASGNLVSFFPPFAGTLNYHTNNGMADDGISVGGVGGIAHKFESNLYLGLEFQATDAFGEESTATNNLTFESIGGNSSQFPIDNTKITTKYALAASLRGGYFFWPNFLSYLKLGLARGQFTVDTSVGGNAFFPSGSSSSTVGSNGLLVGIGIETSTILRNVSLRVEYDYVDYQKINNNFTLTAPPSNPLIPFKLGNINVENSFTPHSDILVVSLVYHGNIFG